MTDFYTLIHLPDSPHWFADSTHDFVWFDSDYESKHLISRRADLQTTVNYASLASLTLSALLSQTKRRANA